MSIRALEETATSNATIPVRVLILEHARHDVELVVFELKSAGFAVQYKLVQDRAEFLGALETGNFDAIFADYRLPDWTGLDAFAELRDSGRDIPFLLVTGTLGEEAAVECIKQGISDYVLKDHLQRLPVALKRSLREKRLREEAAMAMSALAESEARAREQFAELDLLYRTTPVCFAVLDEDLVFLRVNESMARNHGISAEEHIGKTLQEIVPEVVEGATPSYRRVFETGTPVLNVEAQVRRTRPPFELRHYLASFFPVPTPATEKKAVCVMMVDITDRKFAEQALRASEERNRDLFENSIYGICRVSASGDFLDGNPALLRILGCESMLQLREMHLFRDVFRFPEQQAQLFNSCWQVGHVRGTESEWRRLDGGFVSVRLQLRLLRRKEANPEFELIAEDITELRAMERQLLQAQKFEAIGQLAGGIAHDFNNVVGAILGWAEIGYDQTVASPGIADRFARIREQGERAAALTRELLAFARRQVLQPRLIDLNSIANGLVSFLDRVIGKDVELKIVTAPLEPIKADVTQIEQVIMNLCLNARDAMPTGGRLVIETEMVELDDAYCRFYPHVVPGRYAVLSVSDTGVGMDAETKEHIFEPFFTTKEAGKGTGMGLASVYGIVKQHGGFVHVYSEVGQGSLFRVYLPTSPCDGSAAPQLPRAAASGTEMRGTELILIAEDHESIREMSRHTLVNLGYRVLAAADGEEAMRLIERERPALAVLDVVMPKMGGPATAGHLTQRFPGLPIVFTSGYSQDAAGLPATTPRMTYLQKPYSPTALSKLVRQLLDVRTTESRVSDGSQISVDTGNARC